jgi:hypothetical protein
MPIALAALRGVPEPVAGRGSPTQFGQYIEAFPA